MKSETLSYELWVEEALRAVIKRALEQTASQGLPGDHHFFISFLTGRSDVSMPDHLRAEHPSEMTIVLQHQFHDLAVSDQGFSVTLSFSGRPCNLSIPFSAITSFADPAVNFVLQLKMPHQNDEEDLGEAPLEAVETEQPAPPAEAKAEAAEDSQPAPDDKMGEVIALDAFRKK